MREIVWGEIDGPSAKPKKVKKVEDGWIERSPGMALLTCPICNEPMLLELNWYLRESGNMQVSIKQPNSTLHLCLNVNV